MENSPQKIEGIDCSAVIKECARVFEIFSEYEDESRKLINDILVIKNIEDFEAKIAELLGQSEIKLDFEDYESLVRLLRFFVFTFGTEEIPNVGNVSLIEKKLKGFLVSFYKMEKCPEETIGNLLKKEHICSEITGKNIIFSSEEEKSVRTILERILAEIQEEIPTLEGLNNEVKYYSKEALGQIEEALRRA